MNINTFINRRNKFYNAIVLDSVFTRKARKIISKILGFLSVIFAVAFFVGQFVVFGPEYLSDKVLGLFLIFLSFWFFMRLLEWFYNSYLYKDEVKIESGKNFENKKIGPSFSVSVIFYRVSEGDLLKSFIYSSYGQMVMTRLGVGMNEVFEFLANRKQVLDFSKFVGEFSGPIYLHNLSKLIFDKNDEFKDFLFKFGIKMEDVVGASSWVERNLKKERRKARFWGIDNLGRIKGIGDDWSYGGAFVLGKYGREVVYNSFGARTGGNYTYDHEEVDKIEMILSREKEANALLVGLEGVGKDSVIEQLAARIAKGNAMINLKGKKVISLDHHALLASFKTKPSFENEIIKIFNDIVRSGNIILVIENFPDFIDGAKTLGSNLPALLDAYLASSGVQIVALSNVGNFHNKISANEILMRRFEIVMMEEPDESEILMILQDEAEVLESKSQIFFTYPAIVAIERSAENYITEGVMPDKALDLMIEMVPDLMHNGVDIVTKETVLNFIQKKTNMPVGVISEGEKEKLINLEDLLHERVVGQDEAIKVISSALRRARAGVRSMARPIGSFLFIGPTGVGKTEVAKALAEAFFGSEGALSRLDMSEYQSDEGLNKLIGSFDGGKIGLLTKILKEKPYGVLLLDEFEKTNPRVLDLFLQIIDEGFFHDSSGKKINARNIIFIATSNAESALIVESLNSGKDLSKMKDTIINKIIENGIFKPELLNRFDGLVLFHPLEREHYGKIAILMLKKLKERLKKQKSINFIISKPVIDMVIEEGFDPVFGARPMKRVIQNRVEQLVADKIIKGEIKTGSTVEFSVNDFRV